MCHTKNRIAKWGRICLKSLAAVVVAAILYEFLTPTYREGEASIAGRKSADFVYQYAGRDSHFANLRGQVVVLNLWASWCAPCVEETQSLNRLQQDIAPKGGVVLGVSIDEDQEPYDKFLMDHHVFFTTYRDPSREIAKNYGTSMIPETYLIDRGGRFARKIVGAQDWQTPELMRSIETLLAR